MNRGEVLKSLEFWRSHAKDVRQRANYRLGEAVRAGASEEIQKWLDARITVDSVIVKLQLLTEARMDGAEYRSLLGVLKKAEQVLGDLANKADEETINSKGVFVSEEEKPEAATVKVKVRCARCHYEEERDRKVGESFDGLKCPNCDGEMFEVEE